MLLLKDTLLLSPRHQDIRSITGFELLIFLISLWSLLKSALARNVHPKIRCSGILTSSSQSIQHSEFIEGGFSETHVCQVPHLLPLQMPEPCHPALPFIPVSSTQTPTLTDFQTRVRPQSVSAPGVAAPPDSSSELCIFWSS